MRGERWQINLAGNTAIGNVHVGIYLVSSADNNFTSNTDSGNTCGAQNGCEDWLCSCPANTCG